MAAPQITPLTAPTAWFASGGRADVASTALWGSTVLHTVVQSPGDPMTIDTTVRGAMRLDPTFVAPAAYGARLLTRSGDLPKSLDLLEEGARAFPDDPWFPWLLGMQLWKEAGRPEDAARWLDRAADLDPDGTLHRRAARLAEQGLQ